MTLSRDLEAYLYDHIPISRYMAVSVLEANEDRVRLAFPLAPNINHRQTAFGGSVASAAILSAWALLWVRFRDRDAMPRLVVRDNSMRYERPVEGDFIAETIPIDPDAWSKFLSGLERKGKSRIEIQAAVLFGGEMCGSFLGTFVALLPSTGQAQTRDTAGERSTQIAQGPPAR
ncbi:MAG: YiiD C-terminal domain-containing protein [Fimbriimonas sp.]|nr:YiiD C-terminal domain-containing protein [Fimbriimonas sp.]